MPGSVVAAAPSVVMPYSLAVAFQRTQGWAVDENRYRNGEAQHGLLVATSRKRWTQTKRLTAAQLSALRTFFLAHLVTEFYFYDVWDTVGFAYDVTGASPTGRYAVRFEGQWSEVLGLGRNQVDISLVEVS